VRAVRGASSAAIVLPLLRSTRNLWVIGGSRWTIKGAKSSSVRWVFVRLQSVVGGKVQLLGRACHRRGRCGDLIRRDSGAALVEFAIVLPLLLIIVFGIISFGFIFNDKLSITTGTREAGRYGATLPVTNFASTGSPMQEWLDEIAARAVADATGSLDAGVPGRSICVAYVYPNGSAAVDQTKQRLEVGGNVTYSGASCFDDGRPDDERRVQVLVGRDSELEAIFLSATIPLTAESVTRFEASLVAS
jgi:hypothetical protein